MPVLSQLVDEAIEMASRNQGANQSGSGAPPRQHAQAGPEKPQERHTVGLE
ncbi:hypothetical protein [Polaromonas sp. CG9_12]|nr:hypothetical protein [Polaromonas sp. CG9_12]